jgi:phosphatidylinositol glycan class S
MQQQQLDAWLQSKLFNQQQQQQQGFAGTPGQYTLVVLPDTSSSSSTVIVGRSRHAWLTYQPSSVLQQPQQLLSATAAAAVRVLSCCFGLHSSAAALAAADSLPISAAGHTQLSFSLLHADPLAPGNSRSSSSSSHDGCRDSTAAAVQPRHYTWDFEAFEQQYLAPIAASLAPVSHISIESQLLYFTPARTPGSWSRKHNALVVKQSQLSFFVDSDWAVESGRAVMQHDRATADTTSSSSDSPASIAKPVNSHQQQQQPAAAGVLESHVLHFLVYVPAADKSPLLLLGPKGKLRDSNSFWIPSWGGLLVLNLANETAVVTGGSEGQAVAGEQEEERSVPRRPVPLQQQHYQHIAAVVIAQLQALFGVAPGMPSSSGVTMNKLQLQQLPAGPLGFTQWQIDALLRQRAGADVQQAASVLGSLSRLVQQLPNLEMPDLIGQQVSCCVGEGCCFWLLSGF